MGCDMITGSSSLPGRWWPRFATAGCICVKNEYNESHSGKNVLFWKKIKPLMIGHGGCKPPPRIPICPSIGHHPESEFPWSESKPRQHSFAVFHLLSAIPDLFCAPLSKTPDRKPDRPVHGHGSHGNNTDGGGFFLIGGLRFPAADRGGLEFEPMRQMHG